jgi:hypothetical protein
MLSSSHERPETITLMRDIERRYQLASGLRDFSQYAIFYSRIDPAPLLVLGLNPGGSPVDDDLQVASRTFFQGFEHDYVDCAYPIQKVMLPFLMYVLAATADEIRHVPKSNLVFRRSPGENEFRALHGMTMNAGMREARQFVCEIMQHVQPRMILLEAMRHKRFADVYGGGGQGELLRDAIFARFRGQSCRIFDARMMHVECLDRIVPVVSLGHPSSFGRLPEWPLARAATRQVCEQFDIRLGPVR